jgi:hypothetical protein
MGVSGPPLRACMFRRRNETRALRAPLASPGGGGRRLDPATKRFHLLKVGVTPNTFRAARSGETAAAEERGCGMESASLSGPGVVRLLQKEPTPTERYAHAAALLAIVARERQAEPSHKEPAELR